MAPARPIQKALIRPQAVEAKQRVEVAQKAYQAAKAVSPEIVQTQVAVMDVLSHVLVANSYGVWAEDERARARLAVSTVASANGEIQTGFEGPGAGRGFEFFSDLDIEGAAQQAAQTAITMLHAPYAPAGKMAVAVGGGFGGVIFHEACGHSLGSHGRGQRQQRIYRQARAENRFGKGHGTGRWHPARRLGACALPIES